jgi:AAA domain/Bifunctional DNA primase/polymerase, N-terminal
MTDDVGSSKAGSTASAPVDFALAYLRAGLSIVTILADGCKRPAIPWERLQKKPMSEAEARGRWRDGEKGIAVVGGKVSGNAELIDFDRAELFPPWRDLVEAQAPGLFERLCRVRTPRPADHVWYRCTETTIPGNMKLAQEPGTDPKTGKRKAITLIETRGEGGYALVPGCPGACHPTGRTYDHVGGPPLTDLPVITAAEREILIAAARSFDLMSAAKKKRPGDNGSSAGLRPGDDYDRRGPDWPEILEPHGWEQAHRRGAVTYWRRPGKDDRGYSATTGHCKGEGDVELFAVFSSNAHPFEGGTGSRPCSCYGKFAVHTLLNHGGDFKAAAKDLAARGYGDQRAQRNGHTANGRPAGPDGGADAGEPEAPAYTFDVIDSATFARADYRLEWLVRRLLVRGQPVLLGGPHKSLKTSFVVDLALSLGTGTPFLGMRGQTDNAPGSVFEARVGGGQVVQGFQVPRPVRTAVLSGESGEAVLQETARRVCAAKGVDLAAADVLWGFRLPQLASPDQCDALAEGLEQHKVEVLLVDPIYLCLLAGIDAKGIDAANLFQMGPLLLAVAQTCLAVGCTPALVHHTRKNLNAPFEPLELEDLAFAGVQQFARQWLLINRREKFEPGTGLHKLWLNAGGSAGQSGLWALDVDEGVIGDDFTGRRWGVAVHTGSKAREAKQEARKEKKRQEEAETDQQDDAALLDALDRLDPREEGAGYNQVQNAARLSDPRMLRAVLRLKQAKTIRDAKVMAEIGSGATRTVKGLKRCPEG